MTIDSFEPDLQDDPLAGLPEPFLEAIRQVGGVSKMAQLLGVTHNRVSMWKLRKSVPVDMCIAIEVATSGRVTRYQLRPGIFGPTPPMPPHALDHQLHGGATPLESK